MGKKAVSTTKAPETIRGKSNLQRPNPALFQSLNSRLDQIVFLQRAVGNQAVQREFKSGVIQAKPKFPPTKVEVLRAWRKQWKLWQKEGLDDLDCGIAARTVAKSLGGAYKAKVVFQGKPSRNTCTAQECRDAKSRRSKEYRDSITRATPGICVIHEGRPGENLTTRRFTIQPGMLIYTSECCGGTRWACRHMMMYYADGKILDSIHLEKPRPRRFGRTYSRSDSEYVVILEVLDPFAEERYGVEKHILDAVFKTLPFILPIPTEAVK